MSCLGVAKQPPPSLNKQQLPPITTSLKGCRGKSTRESGHPTRPSTSALLVKPPTGPFRASEQKKCWVPLPLPKRQPSRPTRLVVYLGSELHYFYLWKFHSITQLCSWQRGMGGPLYLVTLIFFKASWGKVICSHPGLLIAACGVKLSRWQEAEQRQNLGGGEVSWWSGEM